MVGLRVVPMRERIAILVIGQAVTLCFGLVRPLCHRSPAGNLRVERYILGSFTLSRWSGKTDRPELQINQPDCRSFEIGRPKPKPCSRCVETVGRRRGFMPSWTSTYR